MADDIDLDGLNVKQLRALSDRLALKLARQPRKEVSENGLLLWSAMQDAGVARGAMQAFAAKHGVAVYEEQAQLFAEYLTRACGEVQPKPIRQAVAVKALECLIAHLKRKGIGVSPGIICNAINIVEHAVSIRFPGYAEAKLLHRVALRAA